MVVRGEWRLVGADPVDRLRAVAVDLVGLVGRAKVGKKRDVEKSTQVKVMPNRTNALEASEQNSDARSTHSIPSTTTFASFIRL